jgi:hypothetical protein
MELNPEMKNILALQKVFNSINEGVTNQFISQNNCFEILIESAFVMKNFKGLEIDKFLQKFETISYELMN